MVTEGILETLSVEDLQEQHREYAKVIGVENIVKLSESFGGSSFYIPKKQELVKNRVFRAISEEYNGANIRELCAKYDVAESTVYKVIKDRMAKGARRNIPGQMSFADYNI